MKNEYIKKKKQKLYYSVILKNNYIGILEYDYDFNLLNHNKLIKYYDTSNDLTISFKKLLYNINIVLDRDVTDYGFDDECFENNTIKLNKFIQPGDINHTKTVSILDILFNRLSKKPKRYHTINTIKYNQNMKEFYAILMNNNEYICIVTKKSLCNYIQCKCNENNMSFTYKIFDSHKNAETWIRYIIKSENWIYYHMDAGFLNTNIIYQKNNDRVKKLNRIPERILKKYAIDQNLLNDKNDKVKINPTINTKICNTLYFSEIEPNRVHERDGGIWYNREEDNPYGLRKYAKARDDKGNFYYYDLEIWRNTKHIILVDEELYNIQELERSERVKHDKLQKRNN